MPTPDGGGPISLKPEVSYLITGGLGGVGVEVAKWLVSRGARHLVLANRTAMPPRSEWAVHKGDRRVQAITELEEAGATVDAVAVDVGDSAAMAEIHGAFWRGMASAWWYCPRCRCTYGGCVGRHAA